MAVKALVAVAFRGVVAVQVDAGPGEVLHLRLSDASDAKTSCKDVSSDMMGICMGHHD